MRLLTTGVNAEGRSCVIEDLELPSPVFGSLSGYAHIAYERFINDQAPPIAPPQGHAYKLDLGVGPGLMKFYLLDFAADADGTSDHFHNTDTLEVDIVLEHSFQIVLGDGSSHELSAGDAVILMGNDHARKAGPNGCRMIIIALGTQPQPSFPALTRSAAY
jgi:hypothetical protein